MEKYKHGYVFQSINKNIGLTVVEINYQLMDTLII
jgi:hypothetical protein